MPQRGRIPQLVTSAGKGQNDPDFWAESVWGLKEWLWELCG